MFLFREGAGTVEESDREILYEVLTQINDLQHLTNDLKAETHYLREEMRRFKNEITDLRARGGLYER